MKELDDFDIDDLKDFTDEELDAEVNREKELEELKKQKKIIETRIKELKTEGFRQTGIAKLGKDPNKGVWRVCVLTKYFTWVREKYPHDDHTESKEKWNPIMETETLTEMKKKLTDLVVALEALNDVIKE